MTEGVRAMSARTMREDLGTPDKVFNPLHAEFRFTVDGAAHAQNAKLPRYWDDSLDLDWSGERVWLNPPYGHKNLRRWIGKAWRESQRGALVVCLVPSNTGQVWWTEYAIKASEIRWIRGKLRFEGAKSCAPFASVVLIFLPAVGSNAQVDRTGGENV